ncbi:MAG: hypothetical protein M3N17_01065 [Actinomycetota bacterium]|nr:hypothetical protein [Actinomycetota bacterium]
MSDDRGIWGGVWIVIAACSCSPGGRASDRPAQIPARVTDDGAGFEPDTVARGAGLQNIEDRVEALGGELVVDSAPGRGTTITGRLPAPAPASHRAGAGAEP